MSTGKYKINNENLVILNLLPIELKLVIGNFLTSDEKIFLMFNKRDANFFVEDDLKQLKTISFKFWCQTKELILFALRRKLLSKKYPQVCRYVASNNDLNLLKWCRGENDNSLIFNWNSDTCASAAYNGNIQLLTWLRKNGCPWDSSVCGMAAYGCQLITLQWCRGIGRDSNSDGIGQCPWDEVCLEMAIGNHKNSSDSILEIIKWCRGVGRDYNNDGIGRCPWGEGLFTLAALHNKQDILNWCRNNNF